MTENHEHSDGFLHHDGCPWTCACPLGHDGNPEHSDVMCVAGILPEPLAGPEREVEEKGLRLSITEGRKEGKEHGNHFLHVSGRVFRNAAIKGVVLATSVEILGVDLRTRRSWERGRRRAERNLVFQTHYLITGERQLLRTGLVPARAWGGQAVGIAPTQRVKLWRQMAAAGKKESVSPSLVMGVNNLVVEEELSTMATLAWAEGVWLLEWGVQSR